jgi:HD-like signal output (HDOD) protein
MLKYLKANSNRQPSFDVNLSLTMNNNLKDRTEKVLANISSLPNTPKVLEEMLDLLNNENTPASTLGKVVAKDQGLVTKVLTIANSPMYGLQRQVSTIEFAILVLGFKELRNIVMVLILVESFINKTDKYLDQKEFWIHSYLTGTAAKRLAEDLDFPNDGEAFVAGFLHDMGITIIHRYFHSSFVKIHEQVLSSNKNYRDLEIEELGLTHQQIGYFLLSKWNFPEPLCDAILYHHNPADSEHNKVLASLVHLADYMTKRYSTGNCCWDKNLSLNEEAIHTLRFRDENEIEMFIRAYEELFAHQIDFARFID